MYQHVRTLGKGAFGLVTLVRSQLTGELAAMKTIDRSKLYTENLKKTVEHEIKILKRLKHERIIRLYEVRDARMSRPEPATRHRPTTHAPHPTPPQVIETPRSIHLVMEYSDGGGRAVKEQRRLDEPTASGSCGSCSTRWRHATRSGSATATEAREFRARPLAAR